jgi:2-C-methyl-D-erythritol 4-phosphate cytidylyltransferase
MKKYAVIVAGGSGKRMGTEMPKQFLLLQGKPVLWHTLHTFLSAFDDLEIILVLPQDYIKEGEAIIRSLGPGPNIAIIEGGATRFNSVRNGLAFVTEESVVFVHDGVRCLVTKELIRKCYEQALEKGSAVPAVMATDSIRLVTEDSNTVVDRTSVRIIQTPQTFLSELLLPAFNTIYEEGFTDEATVFETSGKQVFLIEGDYENIKITRATDLVIAENVLAARSALQ